MSRESASLAKSKHTGEVNYPPYECVDSASAAEIRRFRVSSFGKIRESCAHIPYNSGKKDFFEKTGRESFEGTDTKESPRVTIATVH